MESDLVNMKMIVFFLTALLCLVTILYLSIKADMEEKEEEEQEDE